MVLAETLGQSPWEVIASDISLTVLERAQAASIQWSAVAAYRPS
jgi:chemotaxis methyl-accepting protein methylase